MPTIVSDLAPLQTSTRWKDPNFSQTFCSPYYPAHFLERANKYDQKAGTTVGTFLANPMVALPAEAKKQFPQAPPKWMQMPMKDATGRTKLDQDGAPMYRKINADAQAPEYARRAEENYHAAQAALHKIPGWDQYYWDALPYVGWEFVRGQKKPDNYQNNYQSSSSNQQQQNYQE